MLNSPGGGAGRPSIHTPRVIAGRIGACIAIATLCTPGASDTRPSTSSWNRIRAAVSPYFDPGSVTSTAARSRGSKPGLERREPGEARDEQCCRNQQHLRDHQFTRHKYQLRLRRSCVAVVRTLP